MNLRLDIYDLAEHAQYYMKQLGITYEKCDPQSVCDQWWFAGCKNVPTPLPPHLSLLEDSIAESWFGPRYVANPTTTDTERLDWLQNQLKNMDSTNGGTWLRVGDSGRIQVHQQPKPFHPTHTIWADNICIVDSIPYSTDNLRAAIDAAMKQEKENTP